MYDSLVLKLRNAEAPDADFIGETARCLEITGKHDFGSGLILSGTLDEELKVTASRNGVKIGGSLCKWYLGDNFQSLERKDTQKAIEKLSAIFNLPIDKATVSRIDVAQNYIVKKPTDIYLNHLGSLKHSGRAPVTNSMGTIETLYFYQSNGLLVFYDKIKEQKAKRRPIPEPYQDRHVLRYEQRHTKRLPKCFNVESVTASMLYNEKFYIDILNRYKSNYFAIKKINDITLDFEAMTGKKDLYTMGVLTLVEKIGGELAMAAQIKEAYKSGKLSKKAAFDIRQAVVDACKERSGLTVKNDCIIELDKKVRDAIKFYR